MKLKTLTLLLLVSVSPAAAAAQADVPLCQPEIANQAIDLVEDGHIAAATRLVRMECPLRAELADVIQQPYSTIIEQTVVVRNGPDDGYVVEVHYYGEDGDQRAILGLYPDEL